MSADAIGFVLSYLNCFYCYVKSVQKEMCMVMIECIESLSVNCVDRSATVYLCGEGNIVSVI